VRDSARPTTSSSKGIFEFLKNKNVNPAASSASSAAPRDREGVYVGDQDLGWESGEVHFARCVNKSVVLFSSCTVLLNLQGFGLFWFFLGWGTGGLLGLGSYCKANRHLRMVY
jgi:hypothetical protein